MHGKSQLLSQYFDAMAGYCELQHVLSKTPQGLQVAVVKHCKSRSNAADRQQQYPVCNEESAMGIFFKPDMTTALEMPNVEAVLLLKRQILAASALDSRNDAPVLRTENLYLQQSQPVAALQLHLNML